MLDDTWDGPPVQGVSTLGHTLPDRLGPNLRVLFVGINPSSYAVAHGHYFARPQNRFWPAFSASRLGQPICLALGRERLGPENDVDLPRFGIGLTDVVKIHSPMASSVTPQMYREGVPRLLETLRECRPKLVCFHGFTAYRPFARHGLGLDTRGARLGLQPASLGSIPLAVIPNPSPANASYSLVDLIGHYDLIHALLEPGESGG